MNVVIGFERFHCFEANNISACGQDDPGSSEDPCKDLGETLISGSAIHEGSMLTVKPLLLNELIVVREIKTFFLYKSVRSSSVAEQLSMDHSVNKR